MSKIHCILIAHSLENTTAIAKQLAELTIDEIVASHEEWATEQLEYRGFYRKVKGEL